MENRNNILNELKEISPVLAGIDRVNVYNVPAGYFEGFAQNMLPLVKDEQSSLLSSINKQAGSVPAGYFDTLADNILGKIKAQESAETYPILDKISRQNVYTVPQDYFETLSAEIVNKATQPQAKVVSMQKRTGWFKYAAAASVVIMLTFGVYKFINTTNGKIDAVTKEGMAIAKDNKFEEVLTNVTEEDIIQYLQKEGTDVETALVAQTLDVKELPSEEDYLLDEKTLDNFLDNIDIKDLNN
jgi:hypothetical protein